MPDLDETEKRKRGLEFANVLTLLAEDAPDIYCESLIHSAVTKIRKRYGYTWRYKKAALRQHLQRVGGTSSIAELMEMSGWHIDTVTSLIGEMEQDRDIEYYSVPP